MRILSPFFTSYASVRNVSAVRPPMRDAAPSLGEIDEGKGKTLDQGRETYSDNAPAKY
jgi:hypothetical protein